MALFGALLSPFAVLFERICSWLLFDAGLVPDCLTRFALRWMCWSWIRALDCGGNAEKKLQYKMKFVESLSRSPIAVQTDKANEQHYEVPTEYFLLSLGPRMKYSSGLWGPGCRTLEESENEMLRLVCERAQIADGQTILDLGCGWGSMCLYICEHFPKARVIAVSNSASQGEHIRAVATSRNFSNLEVHTADANHFALPAQSLDRVVSIEMFEHMKNYRELMKRISGWLRPTGFLFVQILSHREYAYPMVAKDGSSHWMAREFFSGGNMPSDDLFLYFQEDMALCQHWRVNGVHYKKTLDAWLQKHDNAKAECLKVFATTYGEENKYRRFYMWRMFYLMCAECFGYRNGNEWMVSHYTFQPHAGRREAAAVAPRTAK
eukprot:gnl/Spiro4/3433_TR1672_c0_g1_i1.p1 gnl/Spiro4/3433_TR1672_c0_g1~~gnl/Spiro4/3433_TR1672_c0_g1_i1.p1  ORF type:complete len:388 (+),score=76.98 gnl/Spiro4/3433_TR1672_c0_g1_i1:32-1165(+)